jgi:hypothetical protein
VTLGRTAAPLLLAALLCAAGCVTPEPLKGESFSIEITARGTAKRSITVEARLESEKSSRGRSVELTDQTSIDDDANAQHRVRIEEATTPGEPRPGTGRLDFSTVAVRPIDLIVAYRGHEDIYHLTFPREGGVLVEPSVGEFTHVAVRASK